MAGDPRLASWSLPSAHASAFIGRRAELAQLEQALHAERIVTVVGAGGSGKTRLVTEALARRSGPLDPIAWVDLASVRDSSMLIEHVARASGAVIDPGRGALRSVRAALRARYVLLCLDNCEHLLDAVASLVDTLARDCPGVRVLATSRQPLGVEAEVTWRVPPMRGREAVDLFLDRARRARVGLDLDDAGQAAVEQICRRLDGMPLAIEMAAGWARVLSPAQIDAALDDRFTLLVAAHRGAPSRHETLEASVDWSYRLLPDAARRHLRRTSAFVGWFEAEDAQALSDEARLADVAKCLGALVDASMLTVADDRGVARYRLPETVREFAIRRRRAEGEEDETRRCHLDRVGAAAKRLAELASVDRRRAFDELDRRYGDIGEAVRYALAVDDIAAARELVLALVPYWTLHRNSRDGVSLLQQLLDKVDDPVHLGRLSGGLAMVALVAGRGEVAVGASARALELAEVTGDAIAAALAAAAAADHAYLVDIARAPALARRARTHAAAAGWWFTSDFSLLVEALVLANVDRHAEAVERADELRTRVASCHDDFSSAFAHGVLARCAARTGDLRAAEAHGEIAVSHAAALSHHYMPGVMAIHAWTKALSGDVGAALEVIGSPSTISLSADADLDDGTAVVVGMISLLGGDLADACRRLTRAVASNTADQLTWSTARALPSLAKAHRRAERFDDARAHAERALAAADALNAPHLRAEALDELGWSSVGADPIRAARLHHEALRIRIDHDLHTSVVDSLDALAAIALANENPVDAARLFAASDAARSQIGYPRPRVDGPWHAAETERIEAALGHDGLARHRAEGLGMSLSEAVEYATRARGPRDRPPVGWGSLTPTEQQVIGLLPEGLTNTEIGDRLFMSRSTVKTHLRHIYAKLDVSGRSELVAAAATRVNGDLNNERG